MVNYQLTGTDCTSAAFANLTQLAVAPVISSGDNVINVEMDIAKFWMDRTFAVLFTDGATDAINTKCTRTNILNSLTITDANYLNAKDTLIGNSVGHLLGLDVPVTNALRLKELVDIMTEASQTANATSIDGVKTLAIDTFKRKVLGDDDDSTAVGLSTNAVKAHQVSTAAALTTGCMSSSANRDAFDVILNKHVAFYLDSTFSGAETDSTSVFTDPTSAAGETTDASGNNNVDSIIGALIQQASSFSPPRINQLLGATAEPGTEGTDDDPNPELVDNEKAFHFLHFQVGDVLTFKNTVTVGTPISTNDGGAQGATANLAVGSLIVNFNLTVKANTDANLNDHLVLGSTLGATMLA
jgi:hypothetical protein